MIRPRKARKGFSTIEYLVLLMILMAAFFIFKDYILRGFSGRWKSIGDQFGYGRQYEPQDTVECAFDSEFSGNWYDVTCFENKNCPPGNKNCQRQAMTNCQSNFCDQ